MVGLALIVIAIPLLSQTPAPAKPSFEAVSIKPSAPANNGIRLVTCRHALTILKSPSFI
jgi:hypothetical protein